MAQMKWTCGNYGNELQLSVHDAHSGSHSGACDDDIASLRRKPYIARQLDNLDAESLRRELKEYGAWDADELADHDANLSRWLWICCGDIVDGDCD